MGQTDLKPTAQGQVESSINDTINFIMAKVAAGEIDAATATELIAAARKDYESNVPVTTSAQQAVQPQQTANPYQADPQTACLFEQWGHPIPLLLFPITASHSCPHVPFHQTFRLDPAVTCVGRRQLFFVGCHSAAKSGLTVARSF